MVVVSDPIVSTEYPVVCGLLHSKEDMGRPLGASCGGWRVASSMIVTVGTGIDQ